MIDTNTIYIIVALARQDGVAGESQSQGWELLPPGTTGEQRAQGQDSRKTRETAQSELISMKATETNEKGER